MIGDGIPLGYKRNSDWLALVVPKEFSRFFKETEQSNSSNYQGGGVSMCERQSEKQPPAL